MTLLKKCVATHSRLIERLFNNLGSEVLFIIAIMNHSLQLEVENTWQEIVLCLQPFSEVMFPFERH